MRRWMQVRKGVRRNPTQDGVVAHNELAGKGVGG